MAQTSTPLWFTEIGLIHEASIGVKAKQLVDLYQTGFPIPEGFILPSGCYFDFMQVNKLDYKIQQILDTIAIDRPDSLMQGEIHIKRMFEEAKLSKQLQKQIVDYYKQLGERVHIEMYSTGKASIKHFAATIENKSELLQAIKDAWALMFSAQALWQRHYNGTHHFKTGASVIVQKEISKERSGKIFSIDPDTHDKNRIVITVDEAHSGDCYVITKKTKVIMDRKLKHTINDPKLSTIELEAIAKLATDVEKYLYFPQEITWTIHDGYLFLLKTKPITTLPIQPNLHKRKLPIARGKGITKGISTGKIVFYTDKKPIDALNAIIILPELLPSHIRQLKKAKGIIAGKCHNYAAIAMQLQKLGIPSIIHVETKHFRKGQIVTIHANKGEIYQGGMHIYKPTRGVW